MLTLETQTSNTRSLKTKVLAAVGATAAVGTVAAVMMSSSSSNQGTGLFNIPEDFAGHFSGMDQAGGWTMQGKFHKFTKLNGDWQVDAKINVDQHGYTETYTLKDDVMIYEHPHQNMDGTKGGIMCADRDRLPGYAQFPKLLREAVVLPESDLTPMGKKLADETCPEGSTKVLVNFERHSYVVCADSTANTKAMYAFDEDVSFSAVSRPGMTVNVEHPEGWEKLNCTKFDVTLDRDEAAALDDQVDGRELIMMGPGGEFNPYSGSGYGCGSSQELTISMHYRNLCANMGGESYYGGGGGGSSSGWDVGKKCMFFNGVGNYQPDSWHDRDPIWDSSFTDYWGTTSGGINRNCEDSYFMNSDSCVRRYDNGDYHDEICTAISTAPDFGSDNAVVFTHSNGGPTTFYALKGSCTWNGGYHMSQPPIYGSHAANLCENACTGLNNSFLSILTESSFLDSYCDQRSGYNGAWPGFHGLFHHVMAYRWSSSYSYFRTGSQSDSRMCGSKPLGAQAGDGFKLWLLQQIWDSQRRYNGCVVPCSWRGCTESSCPRWASLSKPWNDGMVDINSCRHANFANGRIDQPRLNHADGTGRNNLGSVKRWFSNKVKYGDWGSRCEYQCYWETTVHYYRYSTGTWTNIDKFYAH